MAIGYIRRSKHPHHGEAEVRTTRKLHRWALTLAAVLALVMGCAVTAQAQGLTVTRITVDGQPAQSLSGAVVRVSAAARATPQTLQVGQALAPGTEITLPRGALVELTSANSNRITVHPGARFVAGMVTNRGELHQPLSGRVDFDVRRALDFFNVQYDRITASVKGTAYTIEIDPRKSLTVTIAAGLVEIERDVQVKIAGRDVQESGDAEGASDSLGGTIRIAEQLKAGQKRTYRLNVTEYLAEFKSFAEAEAYFARALVEAEAGGDTAAVYRAVANSMELSWKIGKPDLTLKLGERCLALARKMPDRVRESTCLRHIGAAHFSLGAYRRAAQHYEKAVALLEDGSAGVQPVLTWNLSHLGRAQHALGDYRAALDSYRRAAAVAERAYGGRDHRSIAFALYRAGITYETLGDYRNALAFMQKALAMQERMLPGADHPDIASSLMRIGRVHVFLNQPDIAMGMLQRSLAMHQRVYGGRDHDGTANVLHNLGRAYQAQRAYRKALEYHEQALAMRRRLYAGRDHLSIASSFQNIANSLASLKDHRKAIEFYEIALAMRERVVGASDHVDNATSLNSMGRSYEALGNNAKAVECYERALAMQQRVYSGRDHPFMVATLQNLARTAATLGDEARAGDYRKKAAAMRQRVAGAK